MRRRRLLLAAALAPAALRAQAFPAGPVTLVVPGPAGSSVDGTARAIGEALSRSLGVPVVVDNRPGAGATIGVAAVAKAVPDGHTLLFTSTSFVQGPHLYKRLPYQPSAFAAVAQVARAPLVLAVSAGVPARTAAEFVALARQAPGRLSYASPGAGTTPHLWGQVLERKAGIDLLHIPYKGTPPAVLDVAAGRVSCVFATWSVLAPQVQAGKLRALGVTGTARLASAPELPTLREAGLEGFEAVGFEGAFVPAGTPRPVVERLAEAIAQAVALPQVRTQLVRAGLEPAYGDPEAFAALVRSQLALWKDIIVASGVTLD